MSDSKKGSNESRAKDKNEEKTLQEFGSLLKELRTSKNKTLAQIAEKLDVSINYVSQIERGVRRVTDEMIKDISVLYSIDEDILFRKAGRIPVRVIEEIESNPMLQKALSYVRKRKLSDEKRKQMEEEILKVYAEFLNVHKDEILKEECASEIGIYQSFINKYLINKSNLED